MIALGLAVFAFNVFGFEARDIIWNERERLGIAVGVFMVVAGALIYRAGRAGPSLAITSQSRHTEEGPRMACRACSSEHPPAKVTWSERNPSRQPRPYHCPQCRVADQERRDREPDYWQIGTVEEAETCAAHGRHRPAPGGCCL
jgi:hypothetical protein